MNVNEGNFLGPAKILRKYLIFPSSEDQTSHNCCHDRNTAVLVDQSLLDEAILASGIPLKAFYKLTEHPTLQLPEDAKAAVLYGHECQEHRRDDWCSVDFFASNVTTAVMEKIGKQHRKQVDGIVCLRILRHKRRGENIEADRWRRKLTPDK